MQFLIVYYQNYLLIYRYFPSDIMSVCYLKVNHVPEELLVTTSSSTTASIQLQFNGVAVFIIKFEVFNLKIVRMKDLLNSQFAIKSYCQE